MINKKPIRLSKAAREFNVSSGTVVTFLEKKGFEVNPSPNTKLTPEMYDLLLKEYSQEKSVKEEAKKHSLKYSKKENISIEDTIEEKSEEPLLDEEDDTSDTIFIKNTSLSAADTLPQEDKKEESHKEPPKPVQPEEQSGKKQEKAAPETGIEESLSEKKSPYILGKIDLDQTSGQKKTTKKEPEQPSEKAGSKKEDETPEVKPSVISKTKDTAGEKIVPAQEKTEKQAQPSSKTKPAEQSVKKVQQQPEASAKKPKPKQEKKSPEKTADKKPESVSHKKGPSEKTADSGKKSATKEEKYEKQVRKSEEDNFIKTKFEKLNGPKILGTIELPAERKAKPEKKKTRLKDGQQQNNRAKKGEGTEQKKPVASSSDQTLKPKKKKRKRIPSSSQQHEQGGSAQHQGDRKHGKPSPHKRKQPQHQEPSEEEVQKQIKETLARLSGGGKSKTSKYRRQKREAQRTKHQDVAEDNQKKSIQVTEFVTVNELAMMLKASVNDVIATCMSLGLFVTINQRLDAETINLVADEYGYSVEFVSMEVQEAIRELNKEADEDEEGQLEERAPIVTVMGHVDHGKTSLLDYIRKTNVIGGEAGGITQHIGAYEVKTQSNKKITFLDTPGHEAFTAMRARGAQVTDISIIVIAADDKIMPQTIEAISHAQAAGTPIVFAINKIDKPGANPEKIKEALSQRNFLVEEWGGKYQSQDISAKNGTGIEDLLEKVLLEAELLELKGNPHKTARGAVVESSLDRGRGYVAKLLVQDGTLRKGDFVLAGSHSGKVKAMYNEMNQVVEQAGPSTPVLMLGLDGAPQAGDQFNVFVDEREAKDIATKRQQLQREQGLRTQKHITLDEIGRRIAIGDFKELNIIVKGDVDGSVEALSDSLLKLGNDEVQVNVIHKSVGQISESDVMLASASDAIIVGFQVRPSVSARRIAEREQIDIRNYSVIYKAIEEIKAAIEGMLSPDIEEKVVCNVEVRNVFKISKVGTIAGCMVLEGVVTRNTRVRVIRDGIVIYTGNIGSLKRMKDDVKEVKAGYECGLNIENFNDIKVGDVIEGFEEIEVARKL